MNAVHAAVIAHLRSAMADRPGKLARDFLDLTDAQVMTLMFTSVRGKGSAARGMRLTSYGLDIMGESFKCVEIKLRDGKNLHAADLVYLDRNARLPYFVSGDKIVVFETFLGMKLRLWDGDIAQLRAIEGL